MTNPDLTPSADYTTVDLNATGTTTVFDAGTATTVWGVYMRNGGSTAEVSLEVTDGTDTARVVDNEGSAGTGIFKDDPIGLAPTEDLQVNVTTAEGAAQTNTLTVLRSSE